MRLFSQEVKNQAELQEIIKKNKEIPKTYRVAVIVFAYDKSNKLILQRRGPKCRDERFKLEGIGGAVEKTDRDFRSALNREIKEEVGENAIIEIKEFITALGESTLNINKNIEEYWILLAYQGILKEGELQIVEPEKNLGFERYLLEQVPEKELSKAAKEFYKILLENKRKENMMYLNN